MGSDQGDGTDGPRRAYEPPAVTELGRNEDLTDDERAQIMDTFSKPSTSDDPPGEADGDER